jgi:hypothetical protein
MVPRVSFNFDAISKFLTDNQSVFQREGRVFEEMLVTREGEDCIVFHFSCLSFNVDIHIHPEKILPETIINDISCLKSFTRQCINHSWYLAETIENLHKLIDWTMIWKLWLVNLPHQQFNWHDYHQCKSNVHDNQLFHWTWRSLDDFLIESERNSSQFIIFDMIYNHLI